MTTIGFVRHGVTAWNKEGRAQGSSDIPLDEEGIQMAEHVANRLENEQWDVIYSSHLIRAKKTAEIIAERKPGIEFFVDNRLREISGGQIEGTTESERIERWGESWRELDLGMETHEELITRGMAFIEDVKAKHPNEKVLVVSHGSYIRRLVRELVADKELDDSLGNTSVTVVKLQDETNYCELYNCMAHLKEAK
ncbi:histidine phosphatase family protein [Sporosarcina sp. Marseille-Q4063]|uniref:histidine phosphatase family protein n=1 Tax=Sporosarcina sp. Marseille-Q4063 TaxID=2810514 RepID=UPI001BB00900|nr:histidine phosphatase family protein [Sporosarcina sp. Marseille-Q4063]QUW22803.1 histidine phosphatase family protein [Sporosarcina sp. Marseille-Q4063]